jgi:hypothetical protein
MKSDAGGKTILEAEVTQIDKLGIWLLIGDNEFFLPFENFPVFRKAAVGAIHNVELLTNTELYWPDLDIEISMESIKRAESPSSPHNP